MKNVFLPFIQGIKGRLQEARRRRQQIKRKNQVICDLTVAATSRRIKRLKERVR